MKHLVTSALPYANGKLHIGHVAGAYLPADIFVRWLRLNKQEVIYICGTDEHGAAITIRAEADGVTPQQVVDFYHKSISQSFDGLGIEFDNFSGTTRPVHHQLAQEFFLNLYYKHYIATKTQTQLYCEHDQRFLPDRYVEGVCPWCGYQDARGDQCDACGKLIDAEKLGQPRCKICGNTPVPKQTTHWYLDLPKFGDKLKSWLGTKTWWKDNVHNFISSWIENGLIERAITRDLSWGIPVPLKEAEGKVLYVWFDAPIGYISATKEWAQQQGEPDKWKEYWLNPECRIYHFIGKDNIPFHTIIWPAMLMEQEQPYTLPWDVPANEYLSLQGEKISTSRNYAIWVEDFLKDFDGELLRYVLAVNAPETKDGDFSWEDFQARVNNELANVLGNLANRVFSFAKKHFDGVLTKPQTYRREAQTTFVQARELLAEIADCYANFRVRKASRLIMDLARLGNRYFDETTPWKTIKTEPEAAAETLFVCCQLLRWVSVAFSPIMPKKMQELRQMLGIDTAVEWAEIELAVKQYTLGDIHPLFAKIDDEVIAQQQVKLQMSVQKAAPQQQELQHKDQIEYDDFAKLELRLVKVLEAEKIKKSKKLFKVTVSFGNQTRTLVAGLAQAYKAEELIGKSVAMLFNLKPRTLMGVESQGMILAAEHDGQLSVLVPDRTDFGPGSEIS